MHTYVEMCNKNTNMKDMQQYQDGDVSKEGRDWNPAGTEWDFKFI